MVAGRGTIELWALPGRLDGARDEGSVWGEGGGGGNRTALSLPAVAAQIDHYLVEQPSPGTQIWYIQLLHKVSRHQTPPASEGSLIVALGAHLTMHFNNGTWGREEE